MQCVEESLLIYNRRHDIHQLFMTDGVIHNILQCQTPLSKGPPPLLFDLSESGIT
jgi:hypothetical protein